MGAVFRGRHTQLGRDVAVKVVNPRLGRSDPVMLQRFVREVRLLAAIRDPHVVRVIDAGQDAGFTYAIMELIRGQSLQGILEAEPQGRLTAGAAAYYLERVARGLAAVHACGVVHRDIKPENVMVDAEGGTKIADFGLARGQDSTQLTMADEVVGTPEYMSPEMISQQTVDPRADLYSLGCMAYQLLAGQTPFNKGNLLLVAQAHLRQEPVPLRVRAHDVPPELEAVVHRLLEKDPARRYPDALQTAAAFAPFADRTPPHRPRPAAEPAAAGDGGAAPELPGWEELYLIKLLAQHQVYPQETLLDGVEAWVGLPAPGRPTFAGFLVERARLPAPTAERGTAVAAQRVLDLRNRIGVTLLQHSSLSKEQLAQLAQHPPPPGVSLVTQAAMRRLISQADAKALQGRIDEAMATVRNRAVHEACRASGVAPLPFERLGALAPERLRAVRRAVVRSLIEQLR